MTNKGITWVLAIMLLFLIALSGGFLVQFAVGNLIENEIEKTLGIRLFLHSFSLMRNSMSTIPIGTVSVLFTPPATYCSQKCIDCYEVKTFLGSTTVCNCDNYEKKFQYGIENQLQYYCCNGLIFSQNNVPEYCTKNTKPITLIRTTDLALKDDYMWECNPNDFGKIPYNEDYTGCVCGDPSKPISERNSLLEEYGVMPNEYGLVCSDFRILPGSTKFILLTRNVQPSALGITTTLQAYPESTLFWDPNYGLNLLNVYTEMPMDLYDYFGVRQSLTSDFSYPQMINERDATFMIYRDNDWNVNTNTKTTTTLKGLSGLISGLFAHCSNVTIPSDENTNNYCLTSGEKDPFMGVRCPLKYASGGQSLYNLLIPAGYKINMTDSLLCEYFCPETNALKETKIDCKWQELSCFDLNELKKECPSCACSKFDYNINLCEGLECISNTSPSFISFNYFDIFNNNQISMNLVKLKGYNYYDGAPVSDADPSVTSVDTLYDFPDCKIYYNLTTDPDYIQISVEDAEITCPERTVNCGCDSKMKKDFKLNSIEEQTLRLSDNPRRYALTIMLYDDIVEREYEVFAYKNENGYTSVKLLPFEDYARSLKVQSLSSDLNDNKFNMMITNPDEQTISLELEEIKPSVNTTPEAVE